MKKIILFSFIFLLIPFAANAETKCNDGLELYQNECKQEFQECETPPQNSLECLSRIIDGQLFNNYSYKCKEGYERRGNAKCEKTGSDLKCRYSYEEYDNQCLGTYPLCKYPPENSDPTTCNDFIKDGTRHENYNFDCLDGFQKTEGECIDEDRYDRCYYMSDDYDEFDRYETVAHGCMPKSKNFKNFDDIAIVTFGNTEENLEKFWNFYKNSPEYEAYDEEKNDFSTFWENYDENAENSYAIIMKKDSPINSVELGEFKDATHVYNDDVEDILIHLYKNSPGKYYFKMGIGRHSSDFWRGDNRYSDSVNMQLGEIFSPSKSNLKITADHSNPIALEVGEFINFEQESNSDYEEGSMQWSWDVANLNCQPSPFDTLLYLNCYATAVGQMDVTFSAVLKDKTNGKQIMIRSNSIHVEVEKGSGDIVIKTETPEKIIEKIEAPISPSFTDVSSIHRYHKAISFIKNNGIVQGYSDGSFKPENKINRAELLKIIIESQFSSDQIATALDEYKIKRYRYADLGDVSMDAWYAPYVRLGIENKIIKGYPDKTFQPGKNVNFIEALKILMESYGIEYSSNTTPWYKSLFSNASDLNLIPMDITDVGQQISRSQMAEMITRFIKYKEGTLNDYLFEEKLK